VEVTDTIPEDATYDPNTEQWVRDTTTKSPCPHGRVTVLCATCIERARIVGIIEGLKTRWETTGPNTSELASALEFADDALYLIRGGDDADAPTTLSEFFDANPDLAIEDPSE
jgi:hypothetical protein